jgi:UDP-N-acetylmuramate dehydrogenase
MYLEENKTLAPYTTFGIGGPARWFVEATREDDIIGAVAWAHARHLPVFVLGGGSNLLVSDSGYNGLVVHVALQGVDRQDQDGRVRYRVSAGENWDSFVRRTIEDDCEGLECLTGIPGTVGGTPVQNVGAYGQEVASSIKAVRAYDLREDRFVDFSGAECGFAYRRSRFNSEDRGRFAVTRVDFALTPGGAPKLRYADLRREFAGQPTPSLAEVAQAVRRIRHSKGMLLVEGDPDCRSAGSFFKNPVVNKEQLQTIASIATTEPPSFPVEGNAGLDHAKIPAAWLIEQAGFSKGEVRGAAGISTRHTLALINRGGATATEILDLSAEIANAVEGQFGVRLEKEPVLLGFQV